MTEKTTKPDRQTALRALARHNGNVTTTAREMGVSRTTIRRWRDEAAQQPNLDALEHTLLAHAAVLAGDLLAGEIVTAPLNQRASALGMLVDRLLKLESRRAAQAAGDPEADTTDEDDQRARLVYRDLKGNLREWGDWDHDEEDEDHANDA
jgi:transposase-like protein